MTTRAETKARTRLALIAAGRELVVEEGLDNPSLDKICERAGFTRGAFYVHFEDRDDFLAAVTEDILAEYTSTIVQTADPAGDLERSVRQFVTSLDELGGRAHLSLLLDGCGRSERVRERFVSAVAGAMTLLIAVAMAGQSAGNVRDDLNTDAIAEVLVAMVFGVLAMRQMGVPLDLERAADGVVAMLRGPSE